MRQHGLSKSRIASFEQCGKKLWLSVHRRELGQYDASSEAHFANGNAVGEVACALHPQGVMVEAKPHLSAAVAETNRLIGHNHPGPIFEATFEHDGVLVRVDVLERKGEGWFAAEVKSSTSVKDYHIGDLATQVWVMQNAGIVLEGAAVRHVNREFTLSNDGDYDGLFADADLLEDISELVQGRAGLVAEARAVLVGEEPVQPVGSHCATPFACEFTDYCRRNIPPGPEWPVTLLPHGGGKKWVERGVEDLLALEEDDLNKRNARILAATRDGVPFHDQHGARAAMSKWDFPRAWLDFETINPAIPRWVGTRPYQQIPFQFSLHLEEANGTVTHHEFLSCDGSDPRRSCAEALLAMIPDGASVIAYNAGFEKRVLRDLAEWFPDLAAPLLLMEAATIDLLPIAREYWYHRDQRGSWSIKAVLPTIVPELEYSGLEIKDGGEAQAAWLEAAEPACDPVRREALARSMKAYCERDTWAMIAVARGLCGTAQGGTAAQ